MTNELQPATLAQVVDVLERMYDPSWARDWDAVGLVCGDPSAPVRRILLAVGILAFTVFLVYVDREGYVDNSDPENEISVVDAMYYTTVTLSTTGYGDIVPLSLRETAVAVAVSSNGPPALTTPLATTSRPSYSRGIGGIEMKTSSVRP